MRIPLAAGDRMDAACAAVVWAAASKLATELAASERPTPPVPRPADGTRSPSQRAWDALLGHWLDEDDQGAIRGIVTFSAALGGRMLLRRSAVIPRGGEPHEDLMLITPEAPTDGADCTYQDTEGHVIVYTATWSDDGRGVEFASAPDEGSPRYRQTWHLADPDTLHVSFDFAPAGGGALVRHAEGALRRVSSQP